MTGTCHAIKFAKYAHRYLAEVQFRFNRRYGLRAILPRLVRAAGRLRRSTKRGFGRAETCRESGEALARIPGNHQAASNL
jgi:hypothetical protein